MRFSSVILGALLGSAFGAPAPSAPAAAHGLEERTIAFPECEAACVLWCMSMSLLPPVMATCIATCTALCAGTVEPGTPIQSIEPGNGTGASLTFHLDGKDVVGSAW